MSFSNTVLLKHILDETEVILQNSDGLSMEKLAEDKILQRAFIRSIEVIGEASKNVEMGFRLKYPELDWRSMAKMRDRLIHHYFDVDIQVVFDTCILDIPNLAFDVKTILLLEENKEDSTDVK